MRAKQQKEDRKFIISGKAFWAHVRKPNELSGKYQLDLSVDEETAKLLDSKGIQIKEEDNENYLGTENDRGQYVTLKQGTELADGTKMRAPLIIDGKKNPVPEDVKIGNGSLVNVQTSIYEWKFKGKTGKSLNLGPIQLKTLVRFESKALDAFPEEEYVHESSAQELRNQSDVLDDDANPFD